jgi:hypothetical protein
MAAGFDFHMTKPVDPQALNEIVSRRTRTSGSRYKRSKD